MGCVLSDSPVYGGTTVQLVTHQYVREKSPGIGFKQLIAIILTGKTLREEFENNFPKIFPAHEISYRNPSHTHVHTQRVCTYLRMDSTSSHSFSCMKRCFLMSFRYTIRTRFNVTSWWKSCKKCLFPSDSKLV